MAMSEAASWLQQALLDLSWDKASAVQLEPDLVSSLVSYCELASPVDASEYIKTILVGDIRCKEVVAEYLRRREGGNGKVDDELHTKNSVEDFYAVTSKKGSKNGNRQKPVGSEGQALGKDRGPSVVSGVASFIKTGVVKTKALSTKAKKGGKSVSLSEAADGSLVFHGGQPCNCQASRHRLMNNCLACGKIVCEQEGEGPCNFCGALVLREGSEYAGLEGIVTVASTDSEAAAIKFKDRLVDYGKNSASRTSVIDDQIDYYQMEGDAWLSAKEKEELQKRQEEVERLEGERRKRVVVTVDLLGGKVIMEDGKANGDSELSILTGDPVSNSERGIGRIKPDPSLQEQPTFVDMKHPPQNGSRKAQFLVQNTGRVQHEDPFLNTLSSLQMKDTDVKVVGGNWWTQSRSNVDYSPKPPQVLEKAERSFEEAEECSPGQRDGEGTAMSSGSNENKNPNQAVKTSKQSRGRALGSKSRSMSDYSTVSPDAFDICAPVLTNSEGRETHLKLAPSLLDQKQRQRKQGLGKTIQQTESVHVLAPGIVFLRSWLTIGEQVEVVNECRKLGLGPGGFYMPTYSGGNSLKLKMMCLGKHWEPNTQSYEVRRSHYDNAEPPAIPGIFVQLVEKALGVAQGSNPEGKKKNREKSSLIPKMRPNICVVNFYGQGGSLGMHQDKAESPDSLKRGSPVVSFSIGDSAEFCFGKDRDLENSEKVVLESGDVFIFGGPARMLYHSITRVHPMTAPADLIEKSNLRPGRLNLTFREF